MRELGRGKAGLVLVVGFVAVACGDDTSGAGGAGGDGGGGTGTATTSSVTTGPGPVTTTGATTTSVTTGTGGEGGSGGAACTGEEAVDLTPCDVVAQDCPDPCLPRCVMYFDLDWPDGFSVQACAPLLGDAGEDEGCERPNGDPGEDTCAEGLYCASIGRPVDATDERTCRPYCHAEGDCDADAACIVVSDPLQAPFDGYCVPRCDPFADACAAGDACVKFTTTTGLYELACSNQTGDLQQGEACSGADCAPGLSCEDFGTGLTCQPFCDDEHPCEQGECLPPPQGRGYSVCSTSRVDLFSPLIGETVGVTGVEIAPDDRIVATVDFARAQTFFGPLDPVDISNSAVVVVDPEGQLVFRRVFGASTQISLVVSPTPDGGVVLAGYAEGVVEIDGAALEPEAGNAVVLRLDDAGEVVWARRFGGDDPEGFRSVAVAGGRVLVGGYLQGTTSFGGADLTTSTSQDIVYAAYDLDDGAHLWSRTVTVGDQGNLRALADGSIVAVQFVPPAGGSFDTFDFGEGGERHVTIELDPSTGDVTSAVLLGEGDFGLALAAFAADTSGRTVFSRSILGATAFGDGEPLAQAGNQDVVVASITDGGLDWAHQPPGSGRMFSRGVALSTTGRVAYTAQVDDGDVTIGDLELSTGAPRRGWLAALDAGDGSVLRAVEVTSLGVHAGAAFLSDDRIVAFGPGGLAIFDLGL